MLGKIFQLLRFNLQTFSELILTKYFYVSSCICEYETKCQKFPALSIQNPSKSSLCNTGFITASQLKYANEMCLPCSSDTHYLGSI